MRPHHERLDAIDLRPNGFLGVPQIHRALRVKSERGGVPEAASERGDAQREVWHQAFSQHLCGTDRSNLSLSRIRNGHGRHLSVTVRDLDVVGVAFLEPGRVVHVLQPSPCPTVDIDGEPMGHLTHRLANR